MPYSPDNTQREVRQVRDALDRSAIVAVTDQAGKIIHVNDKFCEISKFSREELIGQNHRIINAGHHSKDFFVQLWKTISQGKVWEGEVKNRAKDGTFYWVNTTIVPSLNENGKPYEYVSIRYEITQRKYAEEQLRVYREALDRSAIVAITDQTGKIIHINDKFCEISKFSRQELIGQNHRIVNSGHHSKDFFVQLWKTISQGKVWEGEVKNRAKNGNFYWVNTTIVPFLNEQGKPYQYVSIRYEITQRKEAEEQLRVYADQLEHSNADLAKTMQTVLDREAQILMQDRLASVGLLASSLAHEIGTPLGVIRGRAEYLEMKLRDNPEVQKTASVIISQIDRVSKLIRSLLTLARGNQTHVSEPVRPKMICNELTELMGHEFRKGEIELICDIPDDLQVKAESGPLHQVFLNLLVNSLHAIEAAKASGKRKHAINVWVEDREKMWAVKISDTGCGISEKNLKNLFQPFFTTKDIGKGTGLGLATSYRILESWGGRIEVKSREGEGAEFTLVLPKA